MSEDWDQYWGSKSIVSKTVDFARSNYFSKIPIYHMGDVKEKIILEAGCGTSETLVKLAKMAKKVIGFDISEPSLELSRKNFERNKIPKDKYSLVLGDIQKMKFKDNTFDITFNAGVIEHFDDDKVNNQPVKEMIRVTKKGGKIVILVPSVYSLFYLYYLFSRIPGLNRIYPGQEAHRFYSIGMMKKQLNDIKGMYKSYEVKLCCRTMFLYLIAEITK